MRTALEGPASDSSGDEAKRSRTRFLPDNIYDGIRLFKGSKWMSDMLGETVAGKYAEVKQAAGRSLQQGAGHDDQGAGDPVPPRGHQPVPLEPVLERNSSTARPSAGPSMSWIRLQGHWSRVPLVREIIRGGS